MNDSHFALVQDFYELTMANGYFNENMINEVVYFDLFFRNIPDNGGYVITAGLEQIIEYLTTLSFTKSEISFLKSKNLFSEPFLNYLEKFVFTGDIYGMKEGTVCFPYEPLLTVRAPLIEAQLIESFLLLSINHQSLIATKASRIKRAAKDKIVLEFGTRRAHGKDASVLGARAAFIGGVDGTSNVLADYLYQIPSLGTMAHSWIQMFASEEKAFAAYANSFKYNTTLLVDTYNVLKAGVPNAIKTFNQIQVPEGIKNYGIRIDSGDLGYLAKQSRILLDEAGLIDAKITVSNSLDEKLITALLDDSAPIDAFGVGEKLITSSSSPVFGGVYKLVGVEKNGRVIPKIKLSENIEKITLPGRKQVFRLIDKITNKAIADVISLFDEVIDETQNYHLFDPHFPWKQRDITGFKVEKLLIPIIIEGKRVYDLQPLKDIQEYAKSQQNILWECITRLNNPSKYIVDYSKELYDLQLQLIKEMSS